MTNDLFDMIGSFLEFVLSVLVVVVAGSLTIIALGAMIKWIIKPMFDFASACGII